MIQDRDARLPDSAFSEDGYLIDQDQCGGVRYGAWRSDRNGCGWIAAYNLLRALGRETPVCEVIRALLHRSLFRALLGTRLFVIYWYLRRRGFKPEIAAGRKQILAAGGQRRGILLYRHKDGFHFVCFLPDQDDTLRFLNAWTGPRDPVCAMEKFFSSCIKGRLVLALFL